MPSHDADIVRTTLSNGLRVTLDPRPRTPRAAIAVHYGVGFRSEPPGREGFAHLFEHLMFRGSRNLPEGAFHDHIFPVGGSAGGTTHQDYTDFYQVVPLAMLERALFAEADRMAEPVFTESALATQLDGVEQEIRQARQERPYGGLPWPLLPALLFDTHPNAHDGYGSVDALRAVPLGDFVDFHRDYYSPANAVLTVVGGIEPVATLALVERHFGPIAARPIAAAPELAEAPATAARTVRHRRSNIPAPAVALGYRLPDPRAELGAYLAHWLLADLVGRTAPIPLGAGCGLFGPLDARDPDVLIVTGTVEPDIVRALTADYWSLLSDPEVVEGLLPPSRETVVLGQRRRHGDILERARALGRFDSLFGDIGLLERLPALLEAVSAEDVAHAARRLGAAPEVAVVVEPAATPSRLAATVAASGLPGVGAQPDLTFAAVADTVLDSGLRVIAIADHRCPVVEVRIRTPFVAGPVPVDSSGALVCDGEWLDVEAAAAVDDLPAVLAEAAAALAGIRGTRFPESDPLPDPVLRRQWADTAWGVRPAPVGSVVVVVGPADPSALIRRVASAFGSWCAPARRLAGWRSDRLITHPGAGSELELAWSHREPVGDTGSAARYLAIALAADDLSRTVGEIPDSRAHPGRDVFLGRPRAFLRVSTTREHLEAVTTLVTTRIRRLAAERPAADAVSEAADYCAGQLLGIADSPGRLAEAIRREAVAGRGPGWLTALPARLRAVTPEQVAAATRDLFGDPGAVLVVSGDLPETDVRWIERRVSLIDS